ncbi:hypothetical protein ACP70R_026956 [Stipagrostis hirtigluma subsp. patula]
MATTMVRGAELQDEVSKGKKPRTEEAPAGGDLGAFEVLPQELLVSIFAAVSSTAEKPADLFCPMLTCKTFLKVGNHPQVRKVASARCVAVRAARWCRAADHFLRRCGNDGNPDANYLLGMIRFYCLQGKRHQGWSRMVRAAYAGHAEALYSLGLIRVNGSGRAREDTDYVAGVRLCELAALRGHTGALRELGNCHIHGLGVPQDVARGHRLLIWANVIELRAARPSGAPPTPDALVSRAGAGSSSGGGGGALPWRYVYSHPANVFLAEWFAAQPPPPLIVLLCSVPTCGRRETRPLEFRRCPVCSIARYCSRACQALHWRMGHSVECVPVNQWLVAAVGAVVANA